jgi:hypothetical protein
MASIRFFLRSVGFLLLLAPVVRWSTAIALSLWLFWPRPAHARESRFEFEAGADIYAKHYFRVPALTLSDAPPRAEGLDAPSPGAATLGGVAVDIGWTLDNKVIFPMFGFGFASALGPSSRVSTSVDGSIVELRPWTTWMLDLGLPGVGVRFKERRWMFQALVRTGVVVMGMGAGVVTGGEVQDVTAHAVSFYVRVQGEACRRLDPAQRVCLFVAPSVYEYGFGTGGSVGFRWEVGP